MVLQFSAQETCVFCQMTNIVKAFLFLLVIFGFMRFFFYMKQEILKALYAHCSGFFQKLSFLRHFIQFILQNYRFVFRHRNLYCVFLYDVALENLWFRLQLELAM